MARTSKNTSKKNETKEVKQEVKNEIVDNVEIKDNEKIDTTEETISKEEAIAEKDASEETLDNKEEENKDEIIPSEDGDVEGTEEDEMVEPGDYNTEIIDKQVKETVAPRWAKDVYGYNWMGQCYDE